MKWNDFLNLAQDIHFRKVFFLVAFIVAGVLLLLKYRLLPYFNRREDLGHRVLRRVLDIAILLTFGVIAIASVTFWISGNN